MPLLTDLANEIIDQIYRSLDSLEDVVKFGRTSRHIHRIYNETQKLSILRNVAEAQYGPLKPAIHLVTHNNSQLVHHERPSPPMSIALLQDIQRVGRVANKFISIYPSQKWSSLNECAYRRTLTPTEIIRLRRAIYRLWLYCKAYHTPAFTRNSRREPEKMRLRAALLRSWPASELAEILDVQTIIRSMLSYEICPSDATARARNQEQYSLDPSLGNPFAATTNALSMLTIESVLHTGFTRYDRTAARLLFIKKNNGITRGWGDDSTHYYFMEDMLKLSPDLVVMVYDHCNGIEKLDTDAWLDDQEKGLQTIGEDKIKIYEDMVGAEWFASNGQTFGETLAFVLRERGEDPEEMRHAVSQGEMGVVKRAYW